MTPESAPAALETGPPHAAALPSGPPAPLALPAAPPAPRALPEGRVQVFHGTSKRKAFKIAGYRKPAEGFRPDEAGRVFFSREFDVAEHFAKLRLYPTYPSSFTVISLLMPRSLAQHLGLTLHVPVGTLRGARPTVEGTETVVEGQAKVDALNKDPNVWWSLIPIH